MEADRRRLRAPPASPPPSRSAPPCYTPTRLNTSISRRTPILHAGTSVGMRVRVGPYGMSAPAYAPWEYWAGYAGTRRAIPGGL